MSSWSITLHIIKYFKLDIHGSVHHNIILIKMTTKMQQCRTIYYTIFPWVLYTFQAILSLIMRSILTVITASSFIHVCRCRLLSWQKPTANTWIKPEAVIAVKMLLMMSENIVRNMESSQGTINYPTQLHLVGHFCKNLNSQMTLTL